MKINLLLLYFFLLLILSKSLSSQNISEFVIPQKIINERISQIEELKVKWKKNALDECSYTCNVTTSNTGEVKTISLDELIIEFDLPDGYTGDPSEFGIELTDETGQKIFIEGELIEDIIPQDPRIQGFKIKKPKIRVKVNLKKIPDIGKVAKKLIFQPVAKFGTDVWKGFVREVITPIEKNLGKIKAFVPFKVTINGLTEWKFEIEIDIQVGSLLKVKAVGYVVGGASGVTFGGAVTSLTIANFPVPQEYLPKYEKSMTWLEVAASVWCAFPANAVSPPCVKFYSNQIYIDAFKAATGPKPGEALLRQYVIKPFIKDLNNVVTYGTEQILTFPPPEVVTKIASNEIADALKLYGEIKNKDGFLLVKKGFVYATSEDPSLYEGIELVAGILSSDPITGSTTIQPDQSFGEYTVNMKKPQVPGTYYYRAYAIDGIDTIYGTNQTFTVAAACAAGAASSTPTVTANTVMTNITHTTTSATGIGTATGLPAGVTAAWASNTITISGTPTAAGTFNYSIPLTGTSCSAVNATGTITVAAACATGAASSTPTVTVNTTLTNITHTTTSATGIGTATGLPAGVTAAWAANTITISGTPTATGTFNYSIPLTGTSCSAVNATGTITVAAAFICGQNGIDDIDGNFYNTVLIGNQCWTVQNLRVSKYKDGSSIINSTDLGTWSSQRSGAWVYLYNNSDAIGYGKIYNWYAVSDSRGLCPIGWREPSDGDWTTLINYLGGSSIAGGKLKISGTTFWNDPNVGADNSSGFSAIGGGILNLDSPFFSGVGGNAFYWSKDGDSGALGNGNNLVLYQYGIQVTQSYQDKRSGAWVRCLKE